MLATEIVQPRPRRRNRRGYWAEFKAAVEAMQLHDLLIWDVPKADVDTTHVRRWEIHTTDFHTISTWYEGRVFVVRVK